MASVASVLTTTNMTAYGPSKAGVVHLTKQMASGWAKKGITVNTVSPAFVKTDLTKRIFENEEVSRNILNKTPLGRFGELHDLIAPVVFFVSEGASYITGQNLLIDGGRSIYSN